MKYAEKIARLRMIRTKAIGPITFSILLNRYDSAENAIRAIPELISRGGVKTTLASKDSVEKEIENAEKIGAKILVKGEKEYPKPFLNFDDAPGCLTMLGHPHLAQKESLAMVGSRNASINAIAYGENLAKQLSQNGFVIVSGLARGIDATCHKGALKGGTIAVLAGGIDQIYPKENEQLYHQIAEQGLIITEMPLGLAISARLFPIRNRLIASIAIGTIVVEASIKSGSLITARDANERGRDVMAIPGNPMDERSKGCNTLIREGASLVRDVDDILEIVQNPEFQTAQKILKTPTKQDKTHFADHDKERNDIDKAWKILDQYLSFTPTQLDELVRRCDLSVPVANAALLEMEFAGKVIRHHGNSFEKTYHPEHE